MANPPADRTSLQTTLLTLRNQAITHPPGSKERNRTLTQMLRLIQPHLRKIHSPHFPDALQQTLLHFVTHIGTTYDPNLGDIIPWLNSHLWYRHHDLQRQTIHRACREIPIDATLRDHRGYGYTINDLPARPMGSIDLLEQVREQVETDPTGIFRNTVMKQRPDITAQQIILLRLSPETPWQDIADQFQAPLTAIASFYQRHGLRLLRQYGQSEGWL
jgi:hypothetical protein